MNKYERQGIREKKRPQNKRVKSRAARRCDNRKSEIRRAARNTAKAKSVAPAPYRTPFPGKNRSCAFPETPDTGAGRCSAPCGRRTKKRGESPNGFF